MPTRRYFLSGFVAAPLVLPRLGHAAGFPEQLPLTPACADDHDLTPAQTEGPYFTPDSPEKQDFASDAPGGERMTIAGYVMTQNCQPVERALVELWHADQTGTYDNNGFKLRGHQFTDAEGRWWFDTIVPGLYPGRTRHYHLKVQRPGGRVLTTQLYFPGEPDNDRDRL
jgi:protocatechuate 3,4-dioxygenase beta subunit